jgi:hypothetical protein
MKSLARLAISLFSTGSATAAPPATNPDPVRLVQLLGLDTFISGTFNQAVKEASAAGRVTAAQAVCLETGPADFTEELAAVVLRELNAEEMATALAYLSSTDGRKFGEVVTSYANDPSPDFDLSSSEAAAFAAFMDTSAGKKLSDTATLVNTDSYGELIGAKSRQIKEKCNVTQSLFSLETPLKKS